MGSRQAGCNLSLSFPELHTHEDRHTKLKQTRTEDGSISEECLTMLIHGSSASASACTL